MTDKSRLLEFEQRLQALEEASKNYTVATGRTSAVSQVSADRQSGENIIVTEEFATLVSEHMQEIVARVDVIEKQIPGMHQTMNY